MRTPGMCVGAMVCVVASAAPAQDLAEGNAAAWGTFASDGAAASVVDSAERVKMGASSLLFSTQSGFDTGVTYPAGANWSFNASAFNVLTFWEYGDNNTPIGWQDYQPVVVIRTGVGSASPGTIRLTPTSQLTPNHAWARVKVPLLGGPGWTRDTTGTPNLADVDQIEIHHDTWDAGFRIWLDGVRFVFIDPNGLPPPGPPPPPGVDPDRLEPRVLLYVMNPLMENRGVRRMNVVYGWQDPALLASQVRQDFLASSHGKVAFNIVETRVMDEYPLFQDGFQHNDATFAYDWEHRIFHNSTFDYTRFVNDRGIGARVDAGDLDEVWVYSPPIGGMWESAMAGRGAYWINGGAYPQAGGERAFVVMGWNFERGVGEAIHSWGHRAESIMVHSYGDWLPNRSNMWSRFALLDRDAPGLGGVGNVHFPVNGNSDYDYANTRFVQSNADAWLSYPNLNNSTRAMSFHEWSPNGQDPQREYLNWWYAHLPHASGRAPDAYLNNWWRYLCDVDQFKSWNGNLRFTIGIPEVRLEAPAPGALDAGTVMLRAAAEADGAMGRVDFYVDGVFMGTDSLWPYTLAWNARPGEHTIEGRAYELQNGTEGVATPVAVVVRCGADFNGDGFVDFFDFDAYSACFEGSECPAGRDADFNRDGFVDFLDFADFVSGFEAGC